MAGVSDRHRPRMRDRRAGRGRSPEPTVIAPGEIAAPPPLPPSAFYRAAALVVLVFLANAASAYAFGLAVFHGLRPGAGDAAATLGQGAFDTVVTAAFFTAFPLTWIAFRAFRRREKPVAAADDTSAKTRRNLLALDLFALAFLGVWLAILVHAAGTFACVVNGEVVWRLGVGDAVRRAPLASVAEVRTYEVPGRRGGWLPRVDVRFADGAWLRGDSIRADRADRNRFVGAITWSRNVPVRHDGLVRDP